MSVLELKEKLISRILQTENEALLNEVSRLLGPTQGRSRTVKITPKQKRAILEGQEDIEHGRFLTNEQAETEIQEWLNK